MRRTDANAAELLRLERLIGTLSARAEGQDAALRAMDDQLQAQSALVLDLQNYLQHLENLVKRHVRVCPELDAHFKETTQWAKR